MSDLSLTVILHNAEQAAMVAWPFRRAADLRGGRRA